MEQLTFSLGTCFILFNADLPQLLEVFQCESENVMTSFEKVVCTFLSVRISDSRKEMCLRCTIYEACDSVKGKRRRGER